MQSKKTPPKTSKRPENAAAAPEKTLAEAPAKARTSKSSRTKKSEGVDMTSGKHLHKSAAPLVADVAKTSGDVVVHSQTKPSPGAQAGRIDAQEIAELAYSYWLQRGGHHGHAEEDWLRAERELAKVR